MNEAAECYDKLVLSVYGFNVELNFLDKIEEYKKVDLEEFKEWFVKKVETVSKYKGVYKSGRYFRCRICTKNNGRVDIGCFKDELEAAVARDRVLLCYITQDDALILLVLSSLPENEDI